MASDAKSKLDALQAELDRVAPSHGPKVMVGGWVSTITSMYMDNLPGNEANAMGWLLLAACLPLVNPCLRRRVKPKTDNKGQSGVAVLPIHVLSTHPPKWHLAYPLFQ